MPAVEPIAIVGMAGRFPGAADVEPILAEPSGRGRVHLVLLGRRTDRRRVSTRRSSATPSYVGARGVVEDASALRRRLLRRQPPRGRDHRPSAPALPRVRLGGTGERGLRRRRRHSGAVGVYAGVSMNTYLLDRRPLEPGHDQDGGRVPGDARQRQGLPHDPGLLQAESPRPERRRPDRLLDLAGGCPARVPEPANPASVTWPWPGASRSSSPSGPATCISRE